MVCFLLFFNLFLPLPTHHEQFWLSDLFHRFLSTAVEHLLENNACPVSFQNQQQSEVCAQGRCQHYYTLLLKDTRLLKDRMDPILGKFTVKEGLDPSSGIGSSSQNEPDRHQPRCDFWHPCRVIIAYYLVDNPLFWNSGILFCWKLTADQ